MGQEFRYWCPVETWRLLGLVGVMFVMVISLQHFQPPSGNILSSISDVHIDQISKNDSLLIDGVLSKSEKISNMTGISGLNSSGADDARERTDRYGNEKNEDVNSYLVGEESVVLNNSSGLDNLDKESSLQQAVQPQVQVIVNPDNNEANRPVPEESGQKISLESINHPLGNTTANVDLLSEESLGLKKSSVVSDHDNQTTGEKVAQPNSTVDTVDISDESIEPEETEQNFLEDKSSSLSENSGISDSGIASTVLVLPPVASSPNITFPENVGSNIATPVANVDSRISAGETAISENHGKSGELQNNNIRLSDNPPSPKIAPDVKKMPQMLTRGVISVAEMNSLLLQSWSSPNLMKPQWASAADEELLQAKSQIKNAPVLKNDPILHAPLYWNVSMFRRSYNLMEDMLKVYIYKEGEKPILHQPVLKGIYASEGWFMKLLEASKKFVTKNPRKAHLFYLPFSSRNLELKLYVPDSHSHRNLIEYLKNYLDMIVEKYPFWNRTRGVDHFLVACHDWAPAETRALMANCIRALCNSDVKEGFVFGKDVSLPETNVRIPQNPLRDHGGKPASQRSILAFFAGSMHGYLRPILLQHWRNKDPDMKIFGLMPKARGKLNYPQYMKSSKYCICPRGYEVNSPRIVEAIMYECVPVIISDNYVPPFFEVLNWESFAVFMSEKDIPNLKNILLSIPEKSYLQMQMRVKKVQQHFLWHTRPVKYDLFHMILHSVWYNRVFQLQPS